MPKVRLPGTHRAVAPESTWARLEPLLSEFGITRVADVTRLDNIGIPVYIAVRPLSETLATSQGKGATALLAKLSAVMESVELWHAEHPSPPTFSAAPAHLRLPYRLRQLNLRTTDVPLDDIQLNWLTATGMSDGQSVPVPLDVVRLSYSDDHFWRPRIFQTSSTGLASGNTLAEACLHALYEAVERHVLATARVGERVDRATITDDYLNSLLEKLRAAGAELEIIHLPNQFGLPTFEARVWSPLFPVVCSGSGTHRDPCVAASRAITEAVQSRLTEINSTRDDIPSDFDIATARVAASNFGVGGVSFADISAVRPDTLDDWDRELDAVTASVHAATGVQPVMVDLSTRPGLFRVVKVVCPGLTYSDGRMLAA